MKNRKRSEQGQALILLTIGIITLLGFTALAIDGGRTYSEKRTIQGVADTSSMTGALYLGKLGLGVSEASKAEAVAASLVRADSNGYDTTHTQVRVYEDPQYYYVETKIDSTVDPIFAQLIYGGDLNVNATSVARVLKIDNFAMGTAFYAKNEHDCKAFNQGGNASLTILNNGIYSNSDCIDPGSIYFAGTAVMTGEVITAAGEVGLSSNASVTVGALTEGADQQTLPILDPPYCAHLSNQNDNGTTLSPGIYSSGIHVTNKDVFLEPGLYCLDSDFRVQGGTVTGDDVTIYLRGNAGVAINGGDVYMTAPQDNIWHDGATPPMYWNGMLFYQEYGNTSNFNYNGNLDSYLEGTIFVPDGSCSFEGNSTGVGQDIQVICDTIEVVGTTELVIDFNDNNKYIPPFIIDLVQ